MPHSEVCLQYLVLLQAVSPRGQMAGGTGWCATEGILNARGRDMAQSVAARL